jgi:hypothetical protein
MTPAMRPEDEAAVEAAYEAWRRCALLHEPDLVAPPWAKIPPWERWKWFAKATFIATLQSQPVRLPLEPNDAPTEDGAEGFCDHARDFTVDIYGEDGTVGAWCRRCGAMSFRSGGEWIVPTRRTEANIVPRLEADLDRLTTANQVQATRIVELERLRKKDADEAWSAGHAAGKFTGAKNEAERIAGHLRQWADEAEQVSGPPQYEDALRDAAEWTERATPPTPPTDSSSASAVDVINRLPFVLCGSSREIDRRLETYYRDAVMRIAQRFDDTLADMLAAARADERRRVLEECIREVDGHCEMHSEASCTRVLERLLKGETS